MLKTNNDIVNGNFSSGVTINLEKNYTRKLSLPSVVGRYTSELHTIDSKSERHLHTSADDEALKLQSMPFDRSRVFDNIFVPLIETKQDAVSTLHELLQFYHQKYTLISKELQLYNAYNFELIIPDIPNFEVDLKSEEEAIELRYNAMLDMMFDVGGQIFSFKENKLYNKFIKRIEELYNNIFDDEAKIRVDFAMFYIKHGRLQDAIDLTKGVEGNNIQSLDKVLDILLNIKEMDENKLDILTSTIDDYQNEEYIKKAQEIQKETIALNKDSIDGKYIETVSVELMQSCHIFSKLFFSILSEIDCHRNDSDLEEVIHKQKEILIFEAKKIVEQEHTNDFKNYLFDWINSGHIEHSILCKALIEQFRYTEENNGAEFSMNTALPGFLGSTNNMWNEVEKC